MDGLRKMATLLAAVMVVACLIGIATPAFAQMYGGKGMPQAANIGANANMGMGKSIPQASNLGLGKGMPQANVPMGKGIPQAANVGANANMGLGKGMGKGGGYSSEMGFSGQTAASGY